MSEPDPVNILAIEDDPLAPDAPIHHLLSIRHNPLLKDMTPEQLRAMVQKLRTYATSAPSMSAKLSADSAKVNPRNAAKSARRKAVLDDL